MNKIVSSSIIIGLIILSSGCGKTAYEIREDKIKQEQIKAIKLNHSRWLKNSYTHKDEQLWLNNGFGYRGAKKWIDIGISSPQLAKQWKNITKDNKIEVSLWLKAGYNYNNASLWLNKGFLYNEAILWLNEDIKDPDIAYKYNSIGIAPKEAKK